MITVGEFGGNTSSFVIYNYADIQWTTTTNADRHAQVGFDNGDGVNYYQVPGALNQSVININETSNIGIPGKWVFKVDGAQIIEGEVDINECLNTPCHNGGTCANTDGSFNCMCSAGFMGDICDIDINECESDPCQNGGTCTF